MNGFDKRFWLWGYVLEDKIPGKMMFVDGTTSCSAETAVSLLKCGSLFWMNPLHSQEAINEKQYNCIKECDNIFVGLTHVEKNGPGLGGWELQYKESAEKISRFSLEAPNIKGAIIDDFRSPTSPSRNISPEEVKEIKEALTSANPNLKLYVVQYYTIQKPEDVIPFLPYIDGAAIWLWHSTDYFWNGLYEDTLRQWREVFHGKDLIQGQFLHAYGDGNVPQPMDQMKLQCKHIAQWLDVGTLDGWCILNNGWFSKLDHKEQLDYLKSFWDWYRDSRTVR